MNTLLNRAVPRHLLRGRLNLGLALAFSLASMTAYAQGTLPPMVAYGKAAGIGYSPGVADDKISWETFIHVVKPAPPSQSGKPVPDGTLTFEAWATDHDTFVANPPVWPEGVSAQRFQVSALGRSHFKFDASGLPAGALVHRQVHLPPAISRHQPFHSRRQIASPRKCVATIRPSSTSNRIASILLPG